MSEKQQKSDDFPDVSGKLTNEEDKSGLYESSRTDSGFISSGNLLVSGEIPSEEIREIEEDNTSQEQPPIDSGLVEDEEKYHMRLDSGVCLSESFSNLSLKSPGLNDLSSCTKLKLTPQPVAEATNFDEIPWKVYYEQDADGDTHLHSAIEEGFVEVSLALIRAAPHPRLLDTPNDNSQTPLHLSVETGQWRVARWLVVAGARPCPRDVRGDSPLHIATRAGDLNCVKAITDPVQQQEREALQLAYHQQVYQPCNLDQWNYVGQTCVHIAAQNGHIDVLRHLVWYGADINAKEGCMGYTALHYAVEKRDERLVHFLLSECSRLNPQAVTYGRRTALGVSLGLPASIRQALRSKGLQSPYSSEEEFDDSDDNEDDELMVTYENTKSFVPNLVNASA